jgi:hypothetical protein
MDVEFLDQLSHCFLSAVDAALKHALFCVVRAQYGWRYTHRIIIPL